jgi:ferredoxin-thioredoxin reductase catalytic subunit
MMFKLTDDKDLLETLREGLDKKDGHCPCKLEQSRDTICPCGEFIEAGECHCGLFVKVKEG